MKSAENMEDNKMSLVAEYKARKQKQALDKINAGIELHERALDGLESQLKETEKKYNARGFALVMSARSEMGLNDTSKAEVRYADTGEPYGAFMGGILLDDTDRELKRLREDLDFLKGEISRITQKLDSLRNFVKTQEA
jgi:hypothetical protein